MLYSLAASVGAKMLQNVLTIYLSGALGLLFVGTRLPAEVRLVPILLAALVWPVGMPLLAWRTFGR